MTRGKGGKAKTEPPAVERTLDRFARGADISSRAYTVRAGLSANGLKIQARTHRFLPPIT